MTPSPLSYCPAASDVFDRLRRLYVERAQDMVLASFKVPNRALAEYAGQHAAGFCEYPDPDERAHFWDRYLSERAAIHDDSIPCAYLSEMDQGLYGALVGGDPRFLFDPETGWISSMVAPVLKDWSEFDRLTLDSSHPWFRRYLNQLEVYDRVGKNKFGIAHFIMIDGLNFIFELLGATRTFQDLIDRPEMIAPGIEFGARLNLLVQNAFFEHVPLVANGTCSNMAQWIPGRIVSESVDPFHMTSVKYFESWGRENVERMLSHFDGGIVHLHGNGRHLLDAVATIKGLVALNLLDDTGFPLAFELLPQLKKRAGTLPLIVKVEYARFLEALERHELTGGVLYQVQHVPDPSAANRAADQVRQYRV